MMKKTLIAAAIAAVAAAPAMADVSVSGQVKLTVVDAGTSEWAPGFDNALNFKASEDLGNGLTAFAQTSFDTDGNGTSQGTNVSYKDVKLGLKGGFGTVVAGSMETLTQGALSTMMDDGAGNGAGNLETALTSIGRVHALAYVSPTVNGFHVAAAGTLSSADDLVESTDVLVAYDNGPLSVKAALLSIDGGTDVTSIGASYMFGDAKLSALTVEDDDANARDNMYRLDYKMGNNSLLVGYKSADAANADVTVLKLTHSLSKRTKAYIGYKDRDAAAGNDATFVGMIHKF